uniref:Uncharacterized protein n=1 Tax=Pithovirus LCPAC001 TaxID=2506585 RepID=A0A481Z2J0_9VIRU|nr:MAG: hypothetical protein LCPAC001_00310 [Pithovirus LCPAC001]
MKMAIVLIDYFDVDQLTQVKKNGIALKLI